MLIEYQNRIESCLVNCLPSDTSLIAQAMRYSTLKAGKRLRAALIYATASDFEINFKDVDMIACAVECIHAYSLIHDDLPAMDDDDFRRGKASAHKAFGEATAILAGDALNTFAFGLLSKNTISVECKISQIQMLAFHAGIHGMIGGQSMDILLTDKDIELSQLQEIHAKKTGALLSACLHLPAMIYKGYQYYQRNLDDLGSLLGLSYQIIDDVLDVTSDSETLGKTAGKDVEQHKNTYVAKLGLDECLRILKEQQQEIQRLLMALPNGGKALESIISYIFKRNY